jgi:hypothetical protein
MNRQGKSDTGNQRCCVTRIQSMTVGRIYNLFRYLGPKTQPNQAPVTHIDRDGSHGRRDQD